MKELKELTKAEDQVMQILWKLQRGFVKDVIAEMPAPKLAYNTVSKLSEYWRPKDSSTTRRMEKHTSIFQLYQGEAYEVLPEQSDQRETR